MWDRENRTPPFCSSSPFLDACHVIVNYLVTNFTDEDLWFQSKRVLKFKTKIVEKDFKILAYFYSADLPLVSRYCVFSLAVWTVHLLINASASCVHLLMVEGRSFALFINPVQSSLKCLTRSVFLICEILCKWPRDIPPCSGLSFWFNLRLLNLRPFAIILCLHRIGLGRGCGYCRLICSEHE